MVDVDVGLVGAMGETQIPRDYLKARKLCFDFHETNIDLNIKTHLFNLFKLLLILMQQ